MWFLCCFRVTNDDGDDDDDHDDSNSNNNNNNNYCNAYTELEGWKLYFPRSIKVADALCQQRTSENHRPATRWRRRNCITACVHVMLSTPATTKTRRAGFSLASLPHHSVTHVDTEVADACRVSALRQLSSATTHASCMPSIREHKGLCDTPWTASYNSNSSLIVNLYLCI